MVLLVSLIDLFVFVSIRFLTAVVVVFLRFFFFFKYKSLNICALNNNFRFAYYTLNSHPMFGLPDQRMDIAAAAIAERIARPAGRLVAILADRRVRVPSDQRSIAAAKGRNQRRMRIDDGQNAADLLHIKTGTVVAATNHI